MLWIRSGADPHSMRAARKLFIFKPGAGEVKVNDVVHHH
jgi:hypothetical protein